MVHACRPSVSDVRLPHIGTELPTKAPSLAVARQGHAHGVQLDRLKTALTGGASFDARPRRPLTPDSHTQIPTPPRAIRAHLRARGIVALIPQPSDQIGHRLRRSSRGGRPPDFDAADYRSRNVVERRFGHLKQRRGLATRYDKLAVVIAPPPSSTPSLLDPAFVRHALVARG